MDRTIFHSLSLVTIIGASLALPRLADAQTTPAPQSPPNAQMAPSSQQPLVNPSTPNPNPNGTVPNQNSPNSTGTGTAPNRGNGSNGG
jgi:hypothetical protein